MGFVNLSRRVVAAAVIAALGSGVAALRGSVPDPFAFLAPSIRVTPWSAVRSSAPPDGLRMRPSRRTWQGWCSTTTTSRACVAAGQRTAESSAITGSVQSYHVVRGDTLGSIGARFGVDPATLAADNGLVAAAPLAAGPTIVVDNRHLVPAAVNGADIVINIPPRMLFHRDGGIGIHGTNAPGSIYRAATHGCIRLHPDDIAWPFPRVAPGAVVATLYLPVMLAEVEGRVYLEVHADAYRKAPDEVAQARDVTIAAPR